MANRRTKLIDIYNSDTIVRTFILFSQTARGVLKYIDAYLYRKARLSTVQLIVLKTLASNGGVMTPSEIAEWTQTERNNITTLVQRMKQDGLVTAERNSSNRRIMNVTLTNKGREVLDQAMPVAEESVSQVMLSITEGDAILLEKLLRVIRQNAQSGLEDLTKRT